MKIRNLTAIAALGIMVLPLCGCAEEKVDPRLEQAVLKQNQGQRDRDMRERGTATNPNKN